MSGWHTISDSSAYRWVVKRGPTAALFRSGAFARLNRVRTRAMAKAAVRAHPDRFAATRTFCFFVGHVKCGTSLLGAMLDAHPNVILADEVDAIGLLASGFSRDEVFHLLRKGAADEARKGRVTARRLGGYTLAVPAPPRSSSPPTRPCSTGSPRWSRASRSASSWCCAIPSTRSRCR